MTSPVTIEHDDDVCTITLDRPEKLNALNDNVRVELRDAARSLEDDVQTRIVVLRGAGRAFSAGFDLTDPPDTEGAWAHRRHRAGGWQRLLDMWEALPQVTVAAIHGPCIGGALLLAAACDLRVASDDATFSIPEVAIGIPLTWGGVPRLTRELGGPRTRDLVLTGRTVGARELHEWGFVQRLAGHALDDGIAGLVATLRAMPAGALAVSKAGLAGSNPARPDPGWADADLLAAAVREPEQRDAATSYLNDRIRDRQR